MLKIQRTGNDSIVLTVIGRLQADNIGELSALLANEPANRVVTLDLNDLTLVDRQAVRFLQECQARGIRLRRCPGYIRIWIASENEES